MKPRQRGSHRDFLLVVLLILTLLGDLLGSTKLQQPASRCGRWFGCLAGWLHGDICCHSPGNVHHLHCCRLVHGLKREGKESYAAALSSLPPRTACRVVFLGSVHDPEPASERREAVGVLVVVGLKSRHHPHLPNHGVLDKHPTLNKVSRAGGVCRPDCAFFWIGTLVLGAFAGLGSSYKRDFDPSGLNRSMIDLPALLLSPLSAPAPYRVTVSSEKRGAHPDPNFTRPFQPTIPDELRMSRRWPEIIP